MNKYFVDNYLTCGVARDNMMFTKCSMEFFAKAARYLKEDANGAVSAIVNFTPYEFKIVDKFIGGLNNKYKQDIVARDYVISRILEALLVKAEGYSVVGVNLKDIKCGLDDLYSGDNNRVSNFISNAPMPMELDNVIKEMGRVELNLFLEDLDSVCIQKAINNFISSRTSYCVKVFTNQNRLCTYYDQLGNLIQSPHDYLSINIDHYVNFDKNNTIMQS